MRGKKKPSLTQATAATYREAEAVTGYPAAWVREACESGRARTPGGRIDLNAVKAFVTANRDKLESSADQLPLKEQKLAEQVRQLRLRNDHDAGKLVERAWVAERHSRLAGEINGIRSKSEAEDAMLFAATNGDPALCRSILKGIWDRIIKAHRECAKHFEE